MSPGAFLTTLAYRDVPAWTARAEIVDRREHSQPELLRDVVRRARRHRVVVLDGSGHLDQVAGVVLARRRPRPRVIMTDATWSRGGWWGDRVAMRAGLRAMDGAHITYAVLSSEERERFPRTWGVDSARVAFVPFCRTLTSEELAVPPSDDGYAWSGGDSFRDWDTFLAAVRRLPETRFRVASATLASRDGLPPNLEAGRVPHEAFVDQLRRASVAVVPMPAGIERSAGQQTYLNAMAFGKPVVVADAPGVRDHVEDGETGLVVPAGDADALAGALAALAADPGEARALGERARAAVEARFTRTHYAERLLELVDAA